MAQQIINIVPTTELEAVNAMLAAIGEAPLPAGTDLATATQADVGNALNILRNSTREVQSMGWKFNTEFGFEVAPATTFPWIDTAGKTTTLNIFKPAANMLSFKVTPTAEQTGWRMVDAVLRPSRKYLEATKPVIVFYDRSLNRDGFAQTDYPFLYIDPVWAFDFEQMPEEARRFCTIRAARQFVQSGVGSETLAGFTAQDEALALRNLKREHGENDNYNILRNMDTLKHLGGRIRGPAGVTYDPRKSPGPV